MIRVKPFKGIRPQKGLAEKISCPPYDVIDTGQAEVMAKGNPISFLRVIRSEIDLQKETDPYDPKVYQKAKDNLAQMIADGVMVEDKEENFYLYRQVMNGRAQNGIVGCISIDDYVQERVKRHEFTRTDKELDRINHFDACDANTEPVFLFYKKNPELNQLMENWMGNHDPEVDFTDENGVRQILWLVNEQEIKQAIEREFAKTKNLYIADGHHRTASAAKVGLRKRKENPNYTGAEEFNFFLSVIFPEDQLFIMPYNRVVDDLAGLSEEDFLRAVEKGFDIKPCQSYQEPSEPGTFTMILKHQSYQIIPKEHTYDKNHPVKGLDASILQENLLAPILKIQDPRTDKRISFYGGEDMKERIKQKMNKQPESRNPVAFLLYPTQVSDIIRVSDAGEVMPPKSTWFEPKLRSGLFLHRF